MLTKIEHGSTFSTILPKCEENPKTPTPIGKTKRWLTFSSEEDDYSPSSDSEEEYSIGQTKRSVVKWVWTQTPIKMKESISEDEWWKWNKSNF